MSRLDSNVTINWVYCCVHMMNCFLTSLAPWTAAMSSGLHICPARGINYLGVFGLGNLTSKFGLLAYTRDMHDDLCFVH